MSGILRRQPKPPTPRELERVRGEEDRLTQEVVSGDVDFGSLQRANDLASMILVDGVIEKWSSPLTSVPSGDGQSEVIIKNPRYSPAYDPLIPFFSRRFPFGYMTDNEVMQFRSSLHGTVQEARTMVSSDSYRAKYEHIMINTLEKYIAWTVPLHARNGNTIKALTETRVFKQILTPPAEKKKGWFNF